MPTMPDPRENMTNEKTHARGRRFIEGYQEVQMNTNVYIIFLQNKNFLFMYYYSSVFYTYT